MIQLIYISTAGRDITDQSINEILETSRCNNGVNGITGLLLYDGIRFLQALEGNESSVEATYARIKSDPRHRGVVLLSSKTIADKAFGSWAMAAQAVRSKSRPVTLAQQVDDLTASLADLNLQAHFRSFARIRPVAA